MMHWLSRSLVHATFLVTGLALIAQARYVTVLSSENPAAPTLTVLDENLQPIGTVTVPAGAKQVLLSDDGNKLIIIADNTQTPVAFIDLVGGGLGQVRTLSLGGGSGVQGLLSADGARLLVVAKGPPMVYSIPLASEQVSGSPAPLPGDPIEAEITLDGQYLLVLCSPNFLAPIQLNNWQTLQVQAISGSFGSPSLSLSLAPFGSVFVTGPNVLIEFRGGPPFNELARTPLSGIQLSHPGKLQFMPSGGSRAFAANRTQTGHSVGVFDFNLRSATSPAGSYAGGAVALGASGGPFGTTPELIDPLRVTRDLNAVGLAPAIQQVFSFSVGLGGAVLINDFRVGGVPLAGVESLAISNEFPNSLHLFYSNALGVVSRFPLSGVGGLLSRAVARGRLHWVAAPSTAPPGSIYGFGDQVTVPPSAPLRYYVRAIDASGRPVKGRTLNFQAVTSGLQLSQATGTTNRDGWTYVDVTAPSTVGNFTVQVTFGNLTPLTLTSAVATQTGGGGGSGGGSGGGGNPNQPRLVKFSGDGQLAPFGGASSPLVVQALDAEGKPIAGKQVVWQTTSPLVQFISSTQTVTDAEGKAQASLFFVSSVPFGESFSQAAIEAVSDIGNVTFFTTTYPADQFGIPSVQLVKPEASNKVIAVKLGAPAEGAVQLRVVSGGGAGRPFGVPIPKVGLQVVSENQDPAAGPVASCREGIALSDDQGFARCTIVASGKVGTTVLSAVVGGAWTFGGIVLNVLPGDPVPPLIISGNNQTGKTGTTLPRVLVAQIVDAGGNPLPGTQVVWSVSNANALTLFDTVSTANSAGEVTTRVRLGNIAGTFQVTVRAGDLTTTFTVTVESTATTLQKISGDGQTGVPINTAFPLPLVVSVVDAQNAPLAGVPVNWSISGPGTLSASSTPTGTDGRAQVTVTAGATAGTITVTASTGSLSPVTFTLQSRVPGPAVTASSFRNYATSAAGSVAPGTLVLLTGGGIAKNVTDVAVANIFAGRLPQTFRGLVVEFRSGSASSFAPIYWIAKEGQTESALIQVPYEISGTTVEARVSVDGIVTSVNLPVTALSPGIIEDTIDGRRAAVIIRSDGLVVTRATPARRGETVRMYAIGLGQATPLAETNRVGRPDQKVTATVAVGIDNAGVEVIEAKLAENLIGIYEVFFKIPDDAQLGDRPLGLVAAPPGGTPFFGQPSVIPIGPAQ
jgi:uncharacterized protein (TIGR03437 family)